MHTVVAVVVAAVLLLQEKVYSLSIDAKLDENCMADMIAAGYSRVLVYSGDNVANVRGYLQVLYTALRRVMISPVNAVVMSIVHTVRLSQDCLSYMLLPVPTRSSSLLVLTLAAATLVQ
jgi:hypothetical protein